MSRNDWGDDNPVFFGSGATHTLTDEGAPPHRLAGLRSVKTFVSLRDTPRLKPIAIGFHIPRTSDR